MGPSSGEEQELFAPRVGLSDAAALKSRLTAPRDAGATGAGEGANAKLAVGRLNGMILIPHDPTGVEARLKKQYRGSSWVIPA